jgi:3-hydroxyisobutyrate dehydrogenase-like beta-hydroxyacid dehydrogenase
MADVGWIGLGIMGSRMARHLAEAGHAVTVFNRTRARAEAWVAEHGGEVASSPAECAARADILFTTVVDGRQVAEVLLGDDGAARGARDGALFVDCSTIAPGEARAVGAKLGERGIGFLDAPVSGSAPGADGGTLTFMVGGESSALERARPLVDLMAGLVVHCGPLGHGQAVKLITNAVGAANAATLAQALVVGHAEELDLDALVACLEGSAGASKMVTLKATPMREHDFTTLFKVEQMLKDVRLCLEEAQAAGAPFPAAAGARDLLVAAMARGRGEDDFAAVVEPIEGLAGRRLE